MPVKDLLNPAVLTKKVGPLPIYAYVGIGAVGLYVWRKKHPKADAAATAPIYPSTYAPMAYPAGYGAGSGGGSGGGSLGGGQMPDFQPLQMPDLWIPPDHLPVPLAPPPPVPPVPVVQPVPTFSNDLVSVPGGGQVTQGFADYFANSSPQVQANLQALGPDFANSLVSVPGGGQVTEAFASEFQAATPQVQTNLQNLGPSFGTWWGSLTPTQQAAYK